MRHKDRIKSGRDRSAEGRSGYDFSNVGFDFDGDVIHGTWPVR